MCLQSAPFFPGDTGKKGDRGDKGKISIMSTDQNEAAMIKMKQNINMIFLGDTGAPGTQGPPGVSPTLKPAPAVSQVYYNFIARSLLVVNK